MNQKQENHKKENQIIENQNHENQNRKNQMIVDDKKDINSAISAKKNIEIWEDLVDIKHLIISMVICFVTTFGGYILAPNEEPTPLLFGIVGAFIGFIISSFVIKPKRDFVESVGKE